MSELLLEDLLTEVLIRSEKTKSVSSDRAATLQRTHFGPQEVALTLSGMYLSREKVSARACSATGCANAPEKDSEWGHDGLK